MLATEIVENIVRASGLRIATNVVHSILNPTMKILPSSTAWVFVVATSETTTFAASSGIDEIK